MFALSQLDEKWASKKIGLTNLTLGRWGCTITAICMLINEMYGRVVITPPEAAKLWSFDSSGRILWKSSKFQGIGFVHRYYGFKLSLIRKYANDESKGVIVEVNKSHWVYALGVTGNKIAILDPLTATKHQDIPRRYRITGFAVFEKTTLPPQVDEYAKEAVDAAIKSMIAVKWDNPHEVIAGPVAEAAFMKAGLLGRKVAKGGISKQDMVVMMYKNNMFE